MMLRNVIGRVFLNRTLLLPSSVDQKAFFSVSTTRKQTPEETSTSVDENEIKRFKMLADSWWVENGSYEGLHRMNMVRVPWIKDTMVNYKNLLSAEEKVNMINNLDEKEKLYTQDQFDREPLLGLNILDIGCGGGVLSEPLARLGAQVTAIDACKENVIAAQLRAQSEIEKSNGQLKFYDRLRYINCALEDLTVVEENNNYFDAIVMSEVVEHVNNLHQFLSGSTKLLKNNGFTFITTINRTNQSYLLAIIMAEYVLNLVPKGTHTWDKFVKPSEIREILEKNEVFVKFEMGMHYNPITKNWSWSQDKSVNYGLYAQKCIHK